MDLQKTHESICINESVFDGNVEQGIEIDYLLPDYCKSIFKILKCSLTPKITSTRVSGNKLNIDAMAIAKIIYVSEDDSSVCSVEQKQPFSKTVDLSCECDSPEISCNAKTDYVNCRVVNNKRLDIRGAVTVSAKVTKQNCMNAISQAQGMGVQLKKDSITVGDAKRFATKQFSVTHSIDTPYGKPPFENCIYSNAVAFPSDYKVIAGKVIAKGDVMLHILYNPQASEDGASIPETVDASIPISQIIDIPGIDEDYNCVVNFDVISVDVTPSEDKDSIDIEMIVNASCTGYKNKEIDVVTDVYSTKYHNEAQSASIVSDCYLGPVSDSFVIKAEIEMDEGELDRIIDAIGELKNVTASCDSGEIMLSGFLEAGVIATDQDKMPKLLEKSAPFEQRIKAGSCGCAKDSTPLVTPQVASCVYSLSGNNTVEVRAEIKLSGCIISAASHNMISDIEIDEEQPKSNDNAAALTLYFADENEKIWDIAKKYNTNVEAVIAENELESDVVPQKCVLLIPITE